MNVVIKILLAAVIVVAVIALHALWTAWFLEQLWNWLMPLLFGLKQITFWQAFGLLCLSGLLFKSHSSLPSKNE